VTEAVATFTAAWVTAMAVDGKLLWKTCIAAPAARMASDGDHLYLLFAQSPPDGPSILGLDRNGRTVAMPPPEPGSGVDVAAMAVLGDDIVFD
jgi:hypothetical protein